MELAGFEIVILIFCITSRRDQHSGGWWLNLVLPTLMIMGMPPEVANATNGSVFLLNPWSQSPSLNGIKS